MVRLWTLDGRQVSELHGHENFIYALAALPDGRLVSSGEDRTVRIWKGKDTVLDLVSALLKHDRR